MEDTGFRMQINCVRRTRIQDLHVPSTERGQVTEDVTFGQWETVKVGMTNHVLTFTCHPPSVGRGEGREVSGIDAGRGEVQAAGRRAGKDTGRYGRGKGVRSHLLQFH